MPGADELPQSGNEDRNGIVAAPFQGPENGNQDPLGQYAFVAAVAVHDLAGQHREADLALAMVVGRGNLRMIQKREKFIPVFFQPRGQAARIGIGVGCLCNKFCLCLYPDTPSGLVRVQDRRVPDLGDQGFVPKQQDPAQRVPLPEHAPFRPGEAQMEVEGVPDLGERQAQSVMPIVGAAVQAVFFPAVDGIGLSAGVAGMARVSVRFFLLSEFLPGLFGRFEVRRNHLGRGGRRRLGRFHPPGDFQEKKDERFGALIPGLLGQETSLLFPEGGAGVEQFAQDLLNERGRVLFHVHLNFETGSEVTLGVIYFWIS